MTPDPHPDSMDALARSLEHADAIRRACEDLRGQFRTLNTPSTVETVALTALDPTHRLEAGSAAPSLTIYNPSPSIIYMGYAGGRARADARAWSAPPGSMLTLPILAEDLEFGAEADQLAAGDVVFFVMRHHTVMPPFFGAL